MLSFELSAFDIVLSIGVIVLLILFVTTLWKLNPSKEKKRSQGEELYEHEQEKEFTLPPRQPSAPVSWKNTERTASQRIEQAPAMAIGATPQGTVQGSLEQTPRPEEPKEPPKPLKTTSTLAKQNSKTFDTKDCLHHFGYLSGLPKNTPIPGECFGCQKIVDCLVTKKGK